MAREPNISVSIHCGSYFCIKSGRFKKHYHNSWQLGTWNWAHFFIPNFGLLSLTALWSFWGTWWVLFSRYHFSQTWHPGKSSAPGMWKPIKKGLGSATLLRADILNKIKHQKEAAPHTEPSPSLLNVCSVCRVIIYGRNFIRYLCETARRIPLTSDDLLSTSTTTPRTRTNTRTGHVFIPKDMTVDPHSYFAEPDPAA